MTVNEIHPFSIYPLRTSEKMVLTFNDNKELRGHFIGPIPDTAKNNQWLFATFPTIEQITIDGNQIVRITISNL